MHKKISEVSLVLEVHSLNLPKFPEQKILGLYLMIAVLRPPLFAS